MSVRTEVVLNDECSAVTLMFHDIAVADLADVMTAIGSPELVQEYVDGVNAQIPIRRELVKQGKSAELGETRKVFRVARKGD
jgi:hypothetical protein